MLRPAIILACIYSFLGSHLLAGDPITIDTFVLQFDGTDDRVTVPYDASFPTEVFTASARIKLPQPAGRAAIIARGEDDNSFNLSWQLYVTRDDAGALALYIDGEMRASCEGTGIPSSNNFQELVHRLHLRNDRPASRGGGASRLVLPGTHRRTRHVERCLHRRPDHGPV